MSRQPRRTGRRAWHRGPALAVLCGVFLAGVAASAAAQEPEPTTRSGLIEQAQAKKAAELHPYQPTLAEKYLAYAENYFSPTQLRWHPYFISAYAGGGFTLGAGYAQHLGSYNTLNMRGSITFSAYKRIEAEYTAPHPFGRRIALSALGGWREATQVGFYGTGTSTERDDRVNYGFKQPYGAVTVDFLPAHVLVLRGGFEASQWEQTPGSGSRPSVETVYTPESLPGLGSKPTYLHSQGTVGVDWRPSAGYARRGGFYAVTFHDFADTDNAFGFTQVDYEAIQHVPLLREAWVLSFRGAVQTTGTKSGEQIPFYMLPALGGGSSLRGFSSWRFRDRNSLVLQGEWRIMVNRFIDTAVFVDAGKVTAHRSDLNLDALKTDAGFGVRFHGPFATPLRLDIAKGNEKLSLIFSASAVF